MNSMTNKNEPVLEVQLSITQMLDTIEALTEMQLVLHQIVSDSEPGSQTDINGVRKLISILDAKHELESVVIEALKE